MRWNWRCVYAESDCRRLRSIRIGGASFYDLPAAVMESKAAGEGRLEDGLLPTSLFEQVYFNHRKGVVMLNPNSCEGN